MSNDTTTMTVQASEAAIIKKENIATIVQAAPQSYQTNVLSCRRCAEFGQNLLDEAAKNGMSDDLDQRIASFIEKARKTVQVMNERRSPVTKLFDQVRSEFTLLENAIDPAKKDTVPFRLQRLRDTYAAKRREEEEARRRAAEVQRQLELAKAEYRAACEEDYLNSFNNLLNSEINKLSELNASVSLENYAAVTDTVTGFPVTLPSEWCPPSSVRLPYNLSPDDARCIRTEVFAALLRRFEEQYKFEIEDLRQDSLDKLPSKKAELERIVRSDAAEAERVKADLARREAEDAARKERERREKERREKEALELKRQNEQIGGLFAANKAAASAYTPKVKVSRKIVVTDPAAYLSVLHLWWQREGSALSVEELGKIFRKQVTFCEKLADKEEVYAEHPGLEYVEEVKAK